jgi:GAF domain-containing protein
MISPTIPQNETERLASLRSLKLLDTPAEERFDRITRIAAKLLNIPMTQINLVDADRVWVKSSHGIDMKENPRSTSFCGHTINGNQIMEVSNAKEDERFRDNPAVTGDPFISFYAGMPIAGPTGLNVGTLCVLDKTPRVLSQEEKQLLKDLAEWAEIEINYQQLSTIIQDVKQKTGELEDKNAELKKLNDFMVGREMKMIELKEKLARYEKQGNAQPA